jgi:thioredoxin reductase (NADPH)
MSAIEQLVIIGSGPAGLTAAIYGARARLQPLIIEGNEPGGQLVGTSYVENWPGEKKILGVELMQKMQSHAYDAGARFMAMQVQRIDAAQKPFGIILENKLTMKANAIILAMGSSPKRLGCLGEDLYWGKGVSTCAVCDAVFYTDKTVVIVGGGDTAMENASFLRKFTDKITIVHITDTLTASAVMQQRVLKDPTIAIMYESTITEIGGDGTTVTSVVIMHQKTKQKITIPTDGIFVSIGLTPNTIMLEPPLQLDAWGYVVVTDYTKTSVPGIFAAGDVQDFRYRQAITAAGSGCMAALDAERYLSST